MEKEIKKLGQKESEKVSGGYVFGRGELEGKRWEVIDDSSGEVLGRYATKQEAREMAEKKFQSRSQISWDELSDLRDINKR